MLNTPETILNFWFTELESKDWFDKNPTLDTLIRERFSEVHRQARHCELYAWRATPQGRLAEIIILDQFPRNMFRGDPRSFATDPLALALAQEAVASKTDLSLTVQQRAFLYMPYMHSESLAIHHVAMTVFNQPGLENNLAYEIRHKDIIERFGRYPHRNEILGRTSTAEEMEFLKQPGSGF